LISHALDVVAIHSKGLRVGGAMKFAAAMVLPDNDQAKSLLLADDVPERIGTHGLTYCTARGRQGVGVTNGGADSDITQEVTGEVGGAGFQDF
jgi:hypothetical protein